MYYPDMSPYEYGRFAQKIKAEYGLDDETQFLNIGWLDDAFPYEKGTVEAVFLEKLFARVQDPFSLRNFMRGIHQCRFCGGAVETKVNFDLGYHRTFALVNGEKHYLGSAEVFVQYQSTVFIAPNLIYHYITEHHYKPPAPFCEAVMST